jgi:hypothetical protein
VQVFEDQQEWLHLAFPQEHALERAEHALPPLWWVQRQEGAVRWQYVQERQQGRDHVLQRFIERQELPGDLGSHSTRLIGVLDMGIALEQVHDWEIGAGLAVGHRSTFQDQPGASAV